MSEPVFMVARTRRYPSEVDRTEMGERVADSFFFGPLWPIIVLSAREAICRWGWWHEPIPMSLATWRGVP